MKHVRFYRLGCTTKHDCLMVVVLREYNRKNFMLKSKLPSSYLVQYHTIFYVKFKLTMKTLRIYLFQHLFAHVLEVNESHLGNLYETRKLKLTLHKSTNHCFVTMPPNFWATIRMPKIGNIAKHKKNPSPNDTRML